MTTTAFASANHSSSGNSFLPPRLVSGIIEELASNCLTDYEFLKLAGRGSFAEVWQVREKPTGRTLAFKQLAPEWEGQKTARQLLENEAEIGTQVRSPYVIQILASQLAVPPRFVVLEWLDGCSLESLLEEGRQLAPNRALWIARQCAQGLSDLYDAGFTHGDLKPANVCIQADGRLKLLDLGFARPVTAAASERASHGALTGTPEYLAPEALAPGAGDCRDAYSLGVLLYRMLAGKLPFQGETLTAILQQQRRAVAVPLRTLAPHVSREVAEFVERLLAKQPLRRGPGWERIVRELISLEIAAL